MSDGYQEEGMSGPAQDAAIAVEIYTKSLATLVHLCIAPDVPDEERSAIKAVLKAVCTRAVLDLTPAYTVKGEGGGEVRVVN